MTVSRRDLLRYFSATAGCFVAGASPTLLAGCARPGGGESILSYPHGVASADPQSDAVVLWTRVEGADNAASLVCQVASDAEFGNIVSESEALAAADWDYTVRVLVVGLESDRQYFYRFIGPDGSVSRVGRTRTAPDAESTRPLNIAVFSCQDYEQGYFTAYRRLILDDADWGEDGKIDFIMHVGDFIYENIRGESTVGELDHNGNQVKLYNRDGSLRRCGPFPSGGAVGARSWMIPTDLEDFRWLYKKYLADEDLQEARALYPFVQVWDDHEFLNDCWQSYYKNRSVANLKVAANQAWFEYIPAALSVGGRDVDEHRAKDFEPVTVTDTPAADFDDHYLAQEPNNLAAIGSLTIYRSLQWGKTADLFMIDGRSYRGPRGLPQELLNVGRHPYPGTPVDPALIRIMNEGRNALNGNPPEEVTYLGSTMKNPRIDAPMGSMLGRDQKDWLKRGLRKSNATWKLLGLNVGLMRHSFDDSFRDTGSKGGLLWTDGWDGYPAERAEICTFIKNSDIGNVVSLTGDRHAHMAGVVYDDFDAQERTTVLPEFAGGAASAVSRMIIQRELSAHDEAVSKLVTFDDGTEKGYSQAIMPTLNAWMLFGHATAEMIHNGADPDEATNSRDPEVNPHLDYVDSDAHGFFVARLDEDACNVEFVSVYEPTKLQAPGEAPVRRRVKFVVEKTSNGEEPDVVYSGTEGEPPFGGIKT
jgi:alkaline phosphatase D